MPRSLQQRVVRPLPPAAGADSEQLRGQEYPCLGHVQKVGGSHLKLPAYYHKIRITGSMSGQARKIQLQIWSSEDD